GTLALVAADLNPRLAAALLNLIAAEATRSVTLLGEDSEPAGSMPNPHRLWALGECEKGALHSVLQALAPDERASLTGTVAHLQNDLDRLVQRFAPNGDETESLAADWS